MEIALALAVLAALIGTALAKRKREPRPVPEVLEAILGRDPSEVAAVAREIAGADIARVVEHGNIFVAKDGRGRYMSAAELAEVVRLLRRRLH